MRKKTEVTAPQDSLVWRVLDFLQANPGERLTRSDVATKFGADAATIDAELAPGVDAGQLVRETDDGDGVIWRRPRHRSVPRPFAGSITAAKRATRQAPRTFDVSAIKIEPDIPIPDPNRGTIRSAWFGVFERMTAGDSFAAPDEARSSIAHAVAVFRKRRPHTRFVTRTISKTQFRIWRTA